MTPSIPLMTQEISRELAAVLWDAALKGVLLLLVAGGVALALRRASAALRHFVWCVALAGVLVLPALSLLLPALRVPWLPRWTALQSEVRGAKPEIRSAESRNPAPMDPGETRAPVSIGIAAESSEGANAGHTVSHIAGTARNEPASATTRAVATPPPFRRVAFAWLAGVVLAALPLLMGLAQILRLTRRCHPVSDGGWLELLTEVRKEIGLRRNVRLRQGRLANMPLTWGAWRPVLLLPREATDWSWERRRVVLLHELAHVKRFDWLTQTAAYVACGLHWFNPLVWFAARRMRIEREQACDDLVLRCGSRASDYADELLELATSLGDRRLLNWAAVPMARRSSLEGRLLAILDGKRNRASLTRKLVLGALALLAAIVVPVAMVKAGESGDQPQSGRGVGSSQSLVTSAATERGEAVEGVSVRLHADRTRWSSNETPTFTFDLQNSGPRDFITFQLQEMGRVEVDGVWYEWTGAGVWTQSPFRPATSYQGMPVTLAGDWRPSQDRSLNTQPPTYRPLQLPPGKHAIRFAVTCRDSHAPSSKSLINTNSMKPEIVVTSNPVEIEITAFDVVPALAATQWGSSVAGVSAQLRSAHFAWTLDDVVTLSASVRNQGREALQVAQSQELGELQVDGVWYHWARETDVKSSSFSSGREYNDIPVTLTTDWQTRDGEPLQLKPSRHTVRFAMIASALGGAGGTPPIRAMSNPVQIDVAPGVGWRAALVKKYMPGYALRTVRRQTGNQESVAEVLVTLSGEEIDLGSARAGWHGVPSVLPPVGSRVSPLLEPGYWRNAKLTALAPLLKLKIATAVEAEEVARLILGLFKGWSSFEDWTLKAEPSEVGWVVTPAYVGPPTQVRYQGPLELIVEDGVLKDVRERAEMPPRQASVSTKDAIAAEQGWGEAVDGLSVRLQVEKTLWELPETPILKVSVRNQGSETFSVAQTQQPGQLEVDGVWYSWANPFYVTPKPLIPGQVVDAIRVIPDAQWRSGATRLVAGPGKHKFRFTVVADRKEASTGGTIRAVSNPVEIELQWPAETIAALARQTNASANAAPFQPSEVYFGGRVVDDATGQPVTDFAVQFAGTFPMKPDDLVWKPSYRGPILSGRGNTPNEEGRFTAQGYESGKAWARILAEGYLPQPVTPEPVVPPIRKENLVVRMKRAGELRGTVLDHAGKPVLGARVYVAGAQRLDLVDGEPGGMYGVNRSGWTFKGGSATTDAEGRFTVIGGDGTGQEIVVAATDGQMVSVTRITEPRAELKISLPQPAVMIVRYDIADDTPEASLQLRLLTGELDQAIWKDLSSVLEPAVPNRGQLQLTNLLPGTYEFARTKTMKVGVGGTTAIYARRTVVIEAGQTQSVDLVRTSGFAIHGEVTGLKDTDAPGAYIYVRSAEATGNPGVLTDWNLPLFDAMTCDQDGVFRTARLEPGTYTISAEAYKPETPEEARRSGWRLPSYVGKVKLTVTAGVAPAPVRIEMRPRE